MIEFEDVSPVIRAGAAAVTAAAVVFSFGPAFLRFARGRVGEEIKSASAKLDGLQAAKRGTPTMGGLLVIAGVLLAAAAWADVSSPGLTATLAALLGFGAIGAADDLVKLRTSRRGLTGREKLAAQIVVAAGLAGLLSDGGDPWRPLAAAWIVFVVVGTANAVNLTDGMDGLAGGCGVTAATGLTFAALASAAIDPSHAEVAIATAAIAGGLGGFLRFNRFPARVFLGDTGALAVGGAIGTAAIATSHAWLLALCGGVFVAETLSVIAQVAGRDLFGRKPLLCSPLHNHLLFAGVAEPTVVARFWAASAVLTVAGLAVVRFV